MLSAYKKTPVTVPSTTAPLLQSDANFNYNPFPVIAPSIDLEALKALIEADEAFIASIKGEDGATGPAGANGSNGATGATGQKGDKGSSIAVFPTDPVDNMVYEIGDLYLNSATGTIYQRSGITQTQFFAANLQGLVYPNSIWINKGNLKGQNGTNGVDGSEIIFTNGHPYPVDMIEDLSDTPVDSIAINSNTFAVYKRTSNYVTLASNQQIGLGEDYTNGFWQLIGSMKGQNGTNGTNGTNGANAIEILTATGIINFTNANLGKTYIVPFGSATTGINLNSVTADGSFVLLAGKTLSSGIEKVYGSSNQSMQVFEGHYNIINTYANPIMGNAFGKISLNGANGQSNIEILSGTGHYFLTNSQIGKTLIVPSNSAITGINYNNVTQTGATTFLCLKFLVNGFVKEPSGGDPTVLHGESGTHDFFVIENFNTTVLGQSLKKYGLKGQNGTNASPEPPVFYKVLQDEPFEVDSNVKNTKVIVSTDAQYTGGGALIFINESNTLCEFIEVYNPNNFTVSFKTFDSTDTINQEFTIPAKSITLIAKYDYFQYDFSSIIGTAGDSNRM